MGDMLEKEGKRYALYFDFFFLTVFYLSGEDGFMSPSELWKQFG